MTKPKEPAIAPAGGCERLACCIPFCGRTFKNDRKGTPWPKGSEVVCGKHWRLADKSLRVSFRRLSRLIKRIPDDRPRVGVMVTKRANAVFERIKSQVTERAAGIA